MGNLWKTFKSWLETLGALLTLASIIGAFGGGFLVTLLINFWAHVSGRYFAIECVGWFQLAQDDALILRDECSGWLNLAFPAVTIKSGDMVAIVVTVTDETGYGFAIRDDLVHVH